MESPCPCDCMVVHSAMVATMLGTVVATLLMVTFAIKITGKAMVARTGSVVANGGLRLKKGN